MLRQSASLAVLLTLAAIVATPIAAGAQVNPVYRQDPVTGNATQQQLITIPSGMSDTYVSGSSIEIKSGGTFLCDAGAACPAASSVPVTGITGLGSGVGTALQDGVNTSGGFPTQPVANASLGTMAADTIKCNATGGAAVPTDCSLATVLGISSIGSSVTNSLSANVSLSTINTYFDGPSVAQGAIGKWLVVGNVLISDTTTANFNCKLWDGTSVLDSGSFQTPTSTWTSIHLSGVENSPAGNLKISCETSTSSAGANILFNQTGTSKDSTITAVRIQ